MKEPQKLRYAMELDPGLQRIAAELESGGVGAVARLTLQKWLNWHFEDRFLGLVNPTTAREFPWPYFTSEFEKACKKIDRGFFSWEGWHHRQMEFSTLASMHSYIVDTGMGGWAYKPPDKKDVFSANLDYVGYDCRMPARKFQSQLFLVYEELISFEIPRRYYKKVLPFTPDRDVEADFGIFRYPYDLLDRAGNVVETIERVGIYRVATESPPSPDSNSGELAKPGSAVYFTTDVVRRKSDRVYEYDLATFRLFIWEKGDDL